ncbi:hypothetical protein ACBJ59_20975 [Nonomuraea sp. MTCD27]|uniref:hypothetical protein n=1 Tax=Nonomuraea sp. MTCD27 TaxID=1676747 RepID=UPI0035BEC3D5
MWNDRETPANDQSGHRRELAYRQPSPTRAARERRPVLAAIGLLVFLSGVIAAGLIMVYADKRTEVVGVSRLVEAGRPIPVTAMERREVLPPIGAFVPWAERERLGGMVTTVTLLPGTLLTQAMTASAASRRGPGGVAGPPVVGLDRGPGRLPDGRGLVPDIR